MANKPLDELDISPASVVMQAARDFAAALADSQQFKAYEQVTLRYRQDEAAQKDMQAYREKQQSLRFQMKAHAITPEDQAILDQLHSAWLAHASVMEYLEVQAELVAFCQSLGDLLTETVGFDFPATCATSCCG